jgi:hypothetical protein
MDESLLLVPGMKRYDSGMYSAGSQAREKRAMRVAGES